MTEATMASTPADTGYAAVNGLQMYYELHGSGGTPLLLLHGGLFDIDQQFGPLLPRLSTGRRVIATDFQGHGRTNDIDRPLTGDNLTTDVVGLLEQLGIAEIDVFGFSIGGAVALQLAITRPDLVRKAIISSVAFRAEGNRGQNTDVVAKLTVDMIAGTPMERAYLEKSPHPDHEHLQGLLNKLAISDAGFREWSDDDIRGIAGPTLITVGDCDMVRLDHAVKFLQLRGGDVNGDFDGVPSSQLAVLPGTSHFFGLSRTSLISEIVLGFLDEATGAGWSDRDAG